MKRAIAKCGCVTASGGQCSKTPSPGQTKCHLHRSVDGDDDVHMGAATPRRTVAPKKGRGGSSRSSSSSGSSPKGGAAAAAAAAAGSPSRRSPGAALKALVLPGITSMDDVERTVRVIGTYAPAFVASAKRLSEQRVYGYAEHDGDPEYTDVTTTWHFYATTLPEEYAVVAIALHTRSGFIYDMFKRMLTYDLEEHEYTDGVPVFGVIQGAALGVVEQLKDTQHKTPNAITGKLIVLP